MTSLEAFGWGCVVSIAVEIVLFCQALRKSTDDHVPPIYRRKAFIVGRALLVLVAGFLAAASGITQPMQGWQSGRLRRISCSPCIDLNGENDCFRRAQVMRFARSTLSE